MSLSSYKKITLKSSDGETFEVDQTVALESQTIKHMVEVDCADSVIPLPNVTSTILSKVIEYCKKHVEGREEQDDNKSSEDELKKWDADFVNVDHKTLFDLVLAASYLDIKGLVDLTCRTVADMTGVKYPEDILKFLTSPNDDRRENLWVFRRRRRQWSEDTSVKKVEKKEEEQKWGVLEMENQGPSPPPPCAPPPPPPWNDFILGEPPPLWNDFILGEPSPPHWNDFILEEEEEVGRENQWAFPANDVVGCWHWTETAKNWLIIFGFGMFIVVYVIQFFRVLYRIIYLDE